MRKNIRSHHHLFSGFGEIHFLDATKRKIIYFVGIHLICCLVSVWILRRKIRFLLYDSSMTLKTTTMKRKMDDEAWEHFSCVKVFEAQRHQRDNHCDDDRLAAVECDSQSFEQR